MWAQMMSAGLTPGFGYDGHQIVPIGDERTPQMEAALRHEKSVVVAARTGSALALPIKVRGQTIGVVDMQKKTPGSEWTAEEVTLVETLTEQLSVALESARLYQILSSALPASNCRPKSPPGCARPWTWTRY